MSGTFEGVASVAQIVAFAFQTFQGCIEAYKFCHNAQRIGTDGDFLRTKLQIERFRLEDWATRSGLTFRLLTSSEKLKKRYQLNVPEEIKGEGDEKTDEKEPPVAPTGLERLLSALRPDIYTPGARAIDTANNTFKRLRWAAVGRDKLTRVIDDLAKLNDELERLLDAADREWLHSGMGALLREILSRSRSLDEVIEVQKLLHPASSTDQKAIEAAADFKRIRLVLGVDKRSDEVQPERTAKTAAKMPVLKMLKEKKFTPSPATSNQLIKPATYNGAAVLVEWRKADADKFEMLEIHVQCLALLLGSADSSFASLHCIGLLALRKQGQFGLVYDIPEAMEAEKDSPSEHRTLHDLIGMQPKVSLEYRLLIARAISDAVATSHRRLVA